MKVKHCVSIYCFEIKLSATEVGACCAARNTVQLGAWLDHISAGKHTQISF
jgi:hypothetical protein